MTVPLTFWPGASQTHFREQLGVATMLMGATNEFRELSVAWIQEWIFPALKHEQIGFFYNEYNLPVGLVTWAFLAPDVESKLINQPGKVFHESEWNEGENLWFIHFVAAPGWTREIVRYIKENLFEEYSIAFTCRTATRHRVRRVRAWSR